MNIQGATAIDGDALDLLNQLTERFEAEIMRLAWSAAEAGDGIVTAAMLWDVAEVVFESDVDCILGARPKASE